MMSWGPAELRGLRRSAEDGDAKHQNELGNCYYQGLSVEQNFAEAVRWYRKAAVQGYAAAQDNLGSMYEHGRGLLSDYAQAAKWYRTAADDGYFLAQLHLGSMYEDGKGMPLDFVQAYMWLSLAAANQPLQLQGRLAFDGGTPRKRLEIIAKEMSAEQIARAQKMARNWKPKTTVPN